jgi:hypothetical protein
VDRPERHAENAQAEHHRDGHLDHVPRDPLELRPSWNPGWVDDGGDGA